MYTRLTLCPSYLPVTLRRPCGPWLTVPTSGQSLRSGQEPQAHMPAPEANVSWGGAGTRDTKEAGNPRLHSSKFQGDLAMVVTWELLCKPKVKQEPRGLLDPLHTHFSLLRWGLAIFLPHPLKSWDGTCPLAFLSSPLFSFF